MCHRVLVAVGSWCIIIHGVVGYGYFGIVYYIARYSIDRERMVGCVVHTVSAFVRGATSASLFTYLPSAQILMRTDLR